MLDSEICAVIDHLGRQVRGATTVLIPVAVVLPVQFLVQSVGSQPVAFGWALTVGRLGYFECLVDLRPLTDLVAGWMLSVQILPAQIVTVGIPIVRVRVAQSGLCSGFGSRLYFGPVARCLGFVQIEVGPVAIDWIVDSCCFCCCCVL